MAVVGGMKVTQPNNGRFLNQTPPESLVEARCIQLQEQEPLLYLNECMGPNQKNLIFFTTLNGIIFLLNHRTREKVFRVELNSLVDGQKKLNVVYALSAYRKFEKDLNPIFVVHDRVNGVYMINLATKRAVALL